MGAVIERPKVRKSISALRLTPKRNLDYDALAEQYKHAVATIELVEYHLIRIQELLAQHRKMKP